MLRQIPELWFSGGMSSSVDEHSGLVGNPTSEVFHFYRVPLIQESAASELLREAQQKISNQIVDLQTEQCFNIGLDSQLSSRKLSVLKWLLEETFEPENLATESFLEKKAKEGLRTVIVEVGPRLSFTTAWSANAVAICQACGLTEVTRFEQSRRYLLYTTSELQDYQINEFVSMIHDRMTECVYTQKLTSFQTSVVPEEDLEYYTKLFRENIRRNPTNMELFDLAQFNSEHSRHWFFTGKIFIDGQPMNRTLMQIVRSTLQANPNNSVIGFKDNSSAIRGFQVKQLRPLYPVAPYPGAETGAGGRIRDTHATGRESFVQAATAGYCVGNLNAPGFYAPWEDLSFTYPGFCRTFGMRLPSGDRREWLKPIMFSAGIGQIDHIHISKGEPDIGMLVVKIGGPAYLIGMGGGAASSMVSGQNDADLDFNAVQRGKKVSMAVIGTISGDGRVVLVDRLVTEKCLSSGLPPPPPAVDLELQKMLGDMAQKSFEFHRVVYERESLDISPGITVIDSLKRILALPSIPLSDVAVTAQTFTDVTGGACAIGEQPIKASGNWMYAAKLDGEGASMYDAAISLSKAMVELGIAIDGGKDSLSMAAHAGGEVVKAPGNLVISVYVTCPDITKTVTPDLKLEDNGILHHIDLAKGKRRLGGSALAQAFDQVGDECPDLDDIPYLKKVFEGVQDLTDELISAGHDISDGGFLVCALEMAFAGNRGFILDLTSHGKSLFQTLYAEELGLIVEVSKKNLGIVMDKLSGVGVMAEIIGQVTVTPSIEVKVDGVTHSKDKTSILRDMCEETSFQLEKFQRLASCVEIEREGLKHRFEPSWKLSFTPSFTDEKFMSATIKPKVAVIREEGSNGDREMAAAFHAAGFEPWDVTMSDLLNGVISLQELRGIVFVGGFSYADVLDSAKGPQVGGVLGAGEDLSQIRIPCIPCIHAFIKCVMIKDSPAIMFKDMEGSTLGVWAAHGEGRAYFLDDSVLDSIVGSDLAPVRYCDDGGNPTETYPFNVNGSPFGIAAICSPDGRHLAMMPHPERCFLMRQFPWYPKQWDVDKKGPSPWLRMFQNAREWCS
ncbi:PurM-like, C-terminal domain [Sesbania bispinosa]|nr:PurM-like, C-terminal domain [Sesbania bispinosa]